MQTHDFADPVQAKMAQEQCERYKDLMKQFEQMQLPSAHLIPVRKETTKASLESAESPEASVAGRVPSQVSVTSSSDLDSDLASVHSDVLVAEALYLLDQPSSSSTSSEASAILGAAEPSVIQELATGLSQEGERTLEGELPLQRVEDEVRRTQLAIDRLHARYYTPKPLEQAQEDANTLKVDTDAFLGNRL